MIQKYYEVLKDSVEKFKPTGKSSHVPPFLLQPTELDFCSMQTYVPQKPSSYPTGFGEQQGLRSIREAADATYQGISLRVGITTLHLREKQERSPLEAVTLLYTGAAERTAIGDGRATAVERAASVILLETGVVAAQYFEVESPFCYVISWVPKGKEGYGGWPYPHEKQEAKEILRPLFMGTGVSTKTAEFQALSDMVTLAMDTAWNALTRR
ncbi:hypothetical protein HZB02_05865 [Candidatus Woesearchaeota archaeon]|nr:hypothetical protein [Candidatus Woesearchaeota archaeon]